MLDDFVSVVTALGVFFAALQLRESKKIAQSEFEDSLDQQYRELARAIPVEVLLGNDLPSASEYKRAREHIYNYLDLCNEQIYLRRQGRVSLERWRGWREGMRQHLKKPVFARVWGEVKQSALGEFKYLELLEANNFEGGPVKWGLEKPRSSNRWLGWLAGVA